VHLLPHGQIRVLAVGLQIALGRLSRLPAADSQGSRGAMIMNVKARGATRRMPRLVRWLAGRNALRRPVDRIEGALLVTLSAAFLVAMTVASILAAHTYQSQRAASAGLHTALATLIQAGPPYGSLDRFGQAEARWRDPGGGEQDDVLTTITTPGIAGTAAGARIPVWLDHSGQPVAPPAGQVAMIVNALAVGAAATAGAGIALLIFYTLGRLALDRRRLAAWESAWSLTEPRWTTRR
jgi:hypothetical protein